MRGLIRRVVFLGPAHRVYVRGLALPEVAAFDTPLGPVAVDQDAVRKLSALRQVVVAHRALRLDVAENAMAGCGVSSRTGVPA